MNLAQLSDSVRVRLGTPAGDTFFTDPVLADLVNEALLAISTETDWPWLQTSSTIPTVNGTAAYTLAAGVRNTRALTIDGYDPLEWRTLAEIRSIPTTVTGQPTMYTVTQEQILVRPVPAGVYTLVHDYSTVEPVLSGPTSTPVMPSEFHYAIVALACHLAHLRGGDVNRAGAAMADYQGWLKRMVSQRRRSSGPIRVRVRPGGEL